MLCRDGSRLWAVADGMGGHDAGAFASASVVRHLGGVDARATPAAVGEAVRAALDRSNAELRERAAPGRTIGATVVALAADASGFCCVWAGDCRAYQLRGGALTQLTRDHSVVQYLVDAGELDASEAESHPDAHVVTRAVGAAADLKASTLAGGLAAGDRFLLASDGLTRLVSADELLGFVGEDDLQLSADRLIELCLERGAPDNISLVLIRAEGAGR